MKGKMVTNLRNHLISRTATRPLPAPSSVATLYGAQPSLVWANQSKLSSPSIRLESDKNQDDGEVRFNGKRIIWIRMKMMTKKKSKMATWWCEVWRGQAATTPQALQRVASGAPHRKHSLSFITLSVSLFKIKEVSFESDSFFKEVSFFSPGSVGLFRRLSVPPIFMSENNWQFYWRWTFDITIHTNQLRDLGLIYLRVWCTFDSSLLFVMQRVS